MRWNSMKIYSNAFNKPFIYYNSSYINCKYLMLKHYCLFLLYRLWFVYTAINTQSQAMICADENSL